MASLRTWLRAWLGVSDAPAVPPPADPPLGAPRRNPLRMADGVEIGADPDPRETVWKLPDVPPGVLPGGLTPEKLAQDQAPELGAQFKWAMRGAWAEGLEFMGFPYLAELTQRAEYRRPSEIIAKAMTRKWIKFRAKGEEDKSDRLRELEEAFAAYEVRERFRQIAEQDGVFGRAQLYLDTGDGENEDELKTPMPVDDDSKISRDRPLKRLTVVEPMWTYPNQYNSNDPLRPDFFVPVTWFVMGKEVHADRLLTVVSPPPPGPLNPAE